jgi:CHAD domain-containing protein
VSADRELELKYAVGDPDAVRRLVDGETVFGLTGGPWRDYDVVDQYVDTRAGALARAGYGARLRRVDRRTLVTIKSTASRGGNRRTGGGSRGALHDRLELEARATRRLDPRRWPESPARALIEASAGGEPLVTLFTLAQHRSERELTRDGVVVAVLSLDHGVVQRFGRTVGEIEALEVEAAADHPAEARRTLRAIAAELDGVEALRPEQRSKEELALAMLARARHRARPEAPPRKPGVTAEQPLAEAGRRVLRMHLLRMLAAEPGVRSGEGAEAVKKMRVATRRMRAAWRVFDGAFRPRLQKRYVAELREVAQALGAVRDLDVQIERLAAYRAGPGRAANDAVEPLAVEWRRRRGVAREYLLDLLASADYDRFINDYRALVDTTSDAAPGAGPDAAARVRDVAAGRIWRAYERLRGHDAGVPFADVPALHALRIDGKRLRYTLEFLREILPAQVDPLIADVTALQDTIGEMNDSQIAAEMTRAWLLDAATGLTAAQRHAAAAYLRAAERDVARLTRSFRPVWRRITGPTFRRRLAVVAGAI